MQSRIEQQVMAGVGVIWGAKLLASATALKLYVLAVTGWALVQLTWVHMVFQNWAHVGAAGTWTFVTYAVLHTQFAVQLTLAAIAVAGLWLLADLTRSLLAPRPSLLRLQ